MTNFFQVSMGVPPSALPYLRSFFVEVLQFEVLEELDLDLPDPFLTVIDPNNYGVSLKFRLKHSVIFDTTTSLNFFIPDYAAFYARYTEWSSSLHNIGVYADEEGFLAIGSALLVPCLIKVHDAHKVF